MAMGDQNYGIKPTESRCPVPDSGNTCQCWFSINTGPNGECEKCGKVKVPPPHVPDAAPTSAGFVVAKTMPDADADCAARLIARIEERRKLGLARYGKPVTAGDGENYLQHLREELIDGLIYLEALEEEIKRGR